MSDTTTAEGTQVLALQARFPVPPAAVFRALTDAAALRAWLAEDADVGLDQGRFAFWGRSVPQGERGRHRLVAAEPDRLLTFTWTLDGVETAVRIELAADGTQTELTLARWFGWQPEIDPRVGWRISFGVDGEITEFEPGEVLVYGDSEGAVVRWELAGTAGGTHLTFVQSGFGPDELDSAAQHEAGWLGGLADLRRMHELGADWTPVSTDLPD